MLSDTLHRPSLVLGAVLVAAILFAGCGKKGPLYLPGPKQAAPTDTRFAGQVASAFGMTEAK